jgi:Tol biopolymer transport system component
VVLNTGYEIWDIAQSPSGKYIAYAGNKNGNWDIFLYDLQTKQIRQITNTLGNEWDPTFGSTDDDLWFAGVFGFNNGIYRKKLSL